MIPQNWVERGEVEWGVGCMFGFGLKNCYLNCVWHDYYWLKMDSLDGDSLDGSFVVVPFYFGLHWLHWLHWLKMDLAWFVAYHWGAHFNSVFYMLYYAYAIHLNTYHGMNE